MFVPLRNSYAAIAQYPASWSDIIKTITSVVAIPLAVLTFWLGYRQRERERTLSYYHKVVVDFVLPIILEKFATEIDRMMEAGRDALAGVKSTRKTIPRKCNVALSEFGVNLFALQDVIAERTLIFDEQTTDDIRELFQITQDDVTNWFSDVVLHKQRHLEDIEQILRTKQRQLIKRLYKGDFRDF